MGNRSERHRRKTQELVERRLFGNPNDKAAKAEKRRDAQQEYLTNFPRVQFDRFLARVMEGTDTPEILGYVTRHFAEFQTTVDRTEKTETSVYIVTAPSIFPPEE